MALPQITAEMLSEYPLFVGESIDALAWLLDYCPVRAVPARSVLLRPNELNSTLFLLVEGRLEVQLESQSDPAVYHIRPGDCVGEMSLLEGRHTSAFVVAVEDSVVLEIPEDQAWSLINRSYVISRNLLLILSSRLRHNNSLLNESHHLQRIYEHHSKIDPLTGLHNRRWLEEVLERLVQRSSFRHGSLSAIMFDLDHFKQYNDSHGHLAGDTALRSFARVIGAHIRPDDTGARFGGEEFVILLPDTPLEATMEIARRLVESVAGQQIMEADGRLLPPVTVSAGVAALQEQMTGDELISAADAALYRAKSAGRNRASD